MGILSLQNKNSDQTFSLLLLVRLHDQSSSSDEVGGLLQVLQAPIYFLVKRSFWCAKWLMRLSKSIQKHCSENISFHYLQNNNNLSSKHHFYCINTKLTNHVNVRQSLNMFQQHAHWISNYWHNLVKLKILFFLLGWDICTFAWVLSLLGKSLSLKRKLPCLLFDVDMRILIDKALKHFNIL